MFPPCSSLLVRKNEPSSCPSNPCSNCLAISVARPRYILLLWYKISLSCTCVKVRAYFFSFGIFFLRSFLINNSSHKNKKKKYETFHRCFCFFLPAIHFGRQFDTLPCCEWRQRFFYLSVFFFLLLNSNIKTRKKKLNPFHKKKKENWIFFIICRFMIFFSSSFYNFEVGYHDLYFACWPYTSEMCDELAFFYDQKNKHERKSKKDKKKKVRTKKNVVGWCDKITHIHTVTQTNASWHTHTHSDIHILYLHYRWLCFFLSVCVF